MKILALDSAVSACSVAIWSDGVVVAGERAELARGQAEALLPMVARVCAAAGLALADMDRFAVTTGPGHFTGLRTALAAARGLALATGRPLVGIGTLAAVAAGVPAEERAMAILVVALDSKRAEAYLQPFDSGLQALASPTARRVADYAAELCTLHPRDAFVVVGDAGDGLAAGLLERGMRVTRATALPHPDAAIVAALAALAALPETSPDPLYIHPAETTTPVKRRA
jgi:tRNA threonylcarbamoyladenosine biosynthesis protein TsaB